MRITQRKIKEIFKEKGVQLGSGCIDMINEQLFLAVRNMATECKYGNVKRLTPDLFYIALGKAYSGSNE